MINQEKLDSWSFCKLSDSKLEEIKNNIWNKIDFLLKTYWEDNDLLLEIRKNQDLAIQIEENFYKKVLIKIIELYIPNQENIVLFDLDETIVNRYSENNEDYVRVSFFELHKFIKTNFTNIHFWILTARWESNLHLQLESWSLSHIKEMFNKNYIFSSREVQDSYFENEIFNPWEDVYSTYWHINKSNAFHRIIDSEKFKNYILVDDVIDPVFEKLWYWVAVWKEERFVFPEITGIKK